MGCRSSTCHVAHGLFPYPVGLVLVVWGDSYPCIAPVICGAWRTPISPSCVCSGSGSFRYSQPGCCPRAGLPISRQIALCLDLARRASVVGLSGPEVVVFFCEGPQFGVPGLSIIVGNDHLSAFAYVEGQSILGVSRPPSGFLYQCWEGFLVSVGCPFLCWWEVRRPSARFR
jgi:hypothetical protein